ncbi:MAG: competence protein ComEC family protein [Patescibacteria group bacterium]|nr:competence protein ComEC family protein [Patescibacteria group bacterium]
MTNSKIFLYFSIFFIIGISLTLTFQISQLFILGFLIFSLILISVFWDYKKVVVFGFCLLFLVLGMWRFQLFQMKIENNELKNYINQEISLIGIINNQPVQKEKSSKLEVKLTDFEEKILITSFKYPEYEYGDKIRITGTLEEPPVFDSFNYKEYLARNNINGLMFFPKIELLEKDSGNLMMRVLFLIKNNLKQSLNKIVSLPQSALLEGLLFGDEDGFSKEWINKFNLTGTRHITAVSGMNTTILSVLVLNFLLFLGLWRHQAFYLSIVLIIFYILMIGAPASGIRAAVMAIIFLTAQHFGRASDATRAIIFSASLMLFFNPFLLTDIGFQLSFLAVVGLIYLQPFFMNMLKKVPQSLELRYSLAATLSAQAFTFPVLIYNFGYIPLIGPIANVLIVPLLPIITIFGFLVSVLAIFSNSLALIFSFPVYLVLTYILKVIDFSFQTSYLNLVFENVSWVLILISYLVLGFLVWKLQEKLTEKFNF